MWPYIKCLSTLITSFLTGVKAYLNTYPKYQGFNKSDKNTTNAFLNKQLNKSFLWSKWMICIRKYNMYFQYISIPIPVLYKLPKCLIWKIKCRLVVRRLDNKMPAPLLREHIIHLCKADVELHDHISYIMDTMPWCFSGLLSRLRLTYSERGRHNLHVIPVWYI